jgi:hypothetical protein
MQSFYLWPLVMIRLSELIDDQLTFARMQINKQGEHFPILRV